MDLKVGELVARIENVWHRDQNHAAVDWRGLEDMIRETLGFVRLDAVSPHEALALIDEALAAYTLRGNCLDISNGSRKDLGID